MGSVTAMKDILVFCLIPEAGWVNVQHSCTTCNQRPHIQAALTAAHRPIFGSASGAKMPG